MFGHKSFLRIGKLDNAGIKELQDKDYELLNFAHEFHQDIDEKGKVLSDVRGGTISALIDGFPSQELIKWGVEPRVYHDGEIVVMDPDNNILEKIEFRYAACTLFKIHFTDAGKAYCSTKISINAKHLTLGSQIKTDKHWTIE